MPNNNQKVISKGERDKILEGAKIKKEVDSKDKMTIKQAEKAIFEKDKLNLPQLLEQRLNEIETVLENELKDIVGLKSARIHQLISRQSLLNTSSMMGYSAKEMFIVYQSYQQLVEKINKFTLFIPSQKNFCAFAGFSTLTYKNWLQNSDEEKRNVMQMIDDYISDMLLDASKMRKSDAATSIFVAKAEQRR
jgi:predicted Fe-S protein YdhL (DUF1289 family)